MAQDPYLAFAVVAGLTALFVWGRLRYDLVAVIALLAAVFTGLVPHKEAFSGFGDDIVIIVASALVVSAAIERSGVLEAALYRVSLRVRSIQGQAVILISAVAILSAFIKNIGALAMMMPVALQMARRSNASASSFLSRSGQRFTERLRDITLQTGNVVVLTGDLVRHPEKLRDLGILPLSEREIRLGNVRQRLIPVAILGGAILLTALRALPVATAFFAAAVLTILFGALSR